MTAPATPTRKGTAGTYTGATGRVWTIYGADAHVITISTPHPDTGATVAVRCNLDREGSRASALAELIDKLPGDPETLEPEIRADLVAVATLVHLWHGEIQAERRAKRQQPKANHLREVDDSHERPKILASMPDAPVPDTHEIPHPYSVQADDAPTQWPGVSIVRTDDPDGKPRGDTICEQPLVISAWVANPDGTKALRLGWRAGGRWHTRVVEREIIRDASKILKLAAWGIPIHTANRRQVCEYLVAYERTNRPRLTAIRKLQQLGWIGDSAQFALGNEVLGNGGKTTYELLPEGPGELQLASSFGVPTGKIGDWIESVAQPSRAFPRVMAGIYAALAPVLLRDTESPNFVLEWCGKTSTGKTTALNIAASVWAAGDDRAHGSPVRSWDTTVVGLERHAALFNGLPVFLDETKRAKIYGNKSELPGMIYAVCNGQGRARGAVRGSQHTMRWRTICLTTGETPISAMSRDGGTATRVVSMWGSPFGGKSPVVPALTQAVCETYGHLGPAFVRWYVANRDTLDVAAILSAATKRIVAIMPDATVHQRLARYLALIDVAGQLAHKAVDFGFGYEDPITAVTPDIAAGLVDADRPTEAMALVYSAACASQGLFHGRDDPQRPPTTYAGRWDSTPAWQWIALHRPWLNDKLMAAGFDPDPIVREWAASGWIRRDKRNIMPYVRAGSERVRMVVVTRAALQALGLDGASDEPELPLREPGED